MQSLNEPSPTERAAARAEAIAAAVKTAREERGMTIRGLSEAAQVSSSTLWRIENPGDGAVSPKVETIEALATALRWPLCGLLGERSSGGAQGSSEWPDALRELLAARGGFVSFAERAYIEFTLDALRPFEGDSETGRRVAAALNNQDAWRKKFEEFHDSRRWRIIETLAGDDAIEKHPPLISAIWHIVREMTFLARVREGRESAESREEE